VTLGIQAQDEFARFLEKRGSIEYLLTRLEQLSRDCEDAASSAQKEANT